MGLFRDPRTGERCPNKPTDTNWNAWQANVKRATKARRDFTVPHNRGVTVSYEDLESCLYELSKLTLRVPSGRALHQGETVESGI